MKMPLSTKAVSGLLSLVFSVVAVPVQAWSLVKDEEGIAAYTQFSEDLGYNQVRLETIVDAPVESLVAINTDAQYLNQWMESFNQVEVINQTHWHDYVLYVTYDFPFPYQDRDSLSRTFIYKKKDESVVIKFVGEEQGKAPTEDYTRMDYIDGAWELTPISNDQTKVVYTSLVSPGGEGPKWIINAFSLDVPFNSIRNLKEVIKIYQARPLALDELPAESDVISEPVHFYTQAE